MMLLWKHALPLYVFFLCATGDAPRGLCDDTKCCALFQESTNSTAVERRCQDTGGELFNLVLWGDLPALQLPPGLTWIKFARNSVALCLDSPVNRTCTDTVDGFVCQYIQTCKSLLTKEGQYVNYSTALGFEGKTKFVPGTLAVVRATDHPPISKHICAGTQWMRAPWSCEVISGGCEYECEDARGCLCPARQILHPNNFTCTEDPCAKCSHKCVKQGGEWECRCRKGFRLGSGGRCLDVDECSEDSTLCKGKGETCENEEGTYKCTCKEGYALVDEVCVDASICFNCQHYCDVVQGKFECACRKDYRVDPQNSNKCVMWCTEQDCPADCPYQAPDQCFCPPGYIQDVRDKGTVCTDIDECEVEAQCDHDCHNTFGGFICECEEGFQLHDKYRCVLPETFPVMSRVDPTLASAQATALPHYVKTGSILGITVFALLCAALLFCLLHKLSSRVHFYSLKREMEIFTLQQVSTETYKKLSHDWQLRNECHRL